MMRRSGNYLKKTYSSSMNFIFYPEWIDWCFFKPSSTATSRAAFLCSKRSIQIFGIRAVLIDPSIPILITSARYKLLREWAHAYFHNRWWSILTVGNIYIYTTQLKIHHSEYTEESNPVPIPVMVYLNPNVNWTFTQLCSIAFCMFTRGITHKSSGTYDHQDYSH